MKPNIENVLKQGVAAYKEGNIKDAEKLYRAILQSHPLHPDANLLGVLALSVNKADMALPFLKTALEANPKVRKILDLSYVDALIKIEAFDEARQTIAEMTR